MATEQLRLVDGTIVRKCPTDKPLYCSRAGKFYSVHKAILKDEGWVLREIKPVTKQSGRRKCTYTKGSGTHYPFMRHFANKHCHFLVAAAWFGPRPEGLVIDHLNGDIMDWSADNLEYVPPAENTKRSRILRILRKTGRDPKQMTRAELLDLFAHYDFDKLDFDARMSRDMSHHMEC